MRKFLIILFGVLIFQAASAVTFAGDGGTVLPAPISPEYTGDKAVASCKALMNSIEILDSNGRREIFGGDWSEEYWIDVNAGIGGSPNDILACGIKTGGIKLWMVPYYIRYILEFIIGIAGLIAVGGIVYGGYLYLFAGISEDKDKGKKAIMYGVAGMVMTLVAWAFVNIVIAVVTA